MSEAESLGQAIATIRKIRNWSKISEIYGHIDEHFDDLINDLTETSNLEDLY
tara:strand:- start:373 stop:528 length:156 start_codon:yes stop_codon:yes gene_type:complete